MKGKRNTGIIGGQARWSTRPLKLPKFARGLREELPVPGPHLPGKRANPLQMGMTKLASNGFPAVSEHRAVAARDQFRRRTRSSRAHATVSVRRQPQRRKGE